MSADLKTIAFSQNGEQGQGIDNGIHIANPELEQEYYLFKLVNNTRKGSVYLPTVEDVFNPETKTVERMRLLSGIGTVWMREQKDLPKEYEKLNLRSLVFQRGARLMRVDAKDKTALEFLRRSNNNVKDAKGKTGGLFEFYEFDPAKQQKDALAKEEFEIEMAIEAKGQSAENMRKHAGFLGIRLVDDYGLAKTEEGIRREYIVTAKRDPQRFKNTLGSKEVEISYLVRNAITDSKIDLGGPEGRISWANGGVIAQLPQRTDPVKYLTDLALTNSKEGKSFIEHLKQTAK